MAIDQTIVILMTAIPQDTLHQCQEGTLTIGLECLECTLVLITATDIPHHPSQIATQEVIEIDHPQVIRTIPTTLSVEVTGTDIHKRRLTECQERIAILHLLVQ